MSERIKVGLSLATVALISVGCGSVSEITKTIEPDGRRISLTSCKPEVSIFQSQMIIYNCPKAKVITERGPGGTLTVHQEGNPSITFPFSSDAQQSGFGVADWCSVFYSVTGGRVNSMEQSCSYPPGE